MRNKCGVFAADISVERGAFMIQNVSIKMHRSRCCDDAGKIAVAVRLSPSPPQWPDAVPARDARMNI
jgi:hypothetical protein